MMRRMLKVVSLFMCMGFAASCAYAVELKPSGWIGNLTAYKQGSGAIGQLYPTKDMEPFTYSHIRGRMKLDFQHDDKSGAVFQAEIDYDMGDSSYTVGRNQGGGLAGDSMNLETKQFYLYFPVTENIKGTVGLNWITDNFDWAILSNDAAGFSLDYKKDDVTAAARYLRFWDGGKDSMTNDVDMIMLSGSKQISEKTKAGLAYYYLMDGSGKDGNGKLNVDALSLENGVANYSANAATGFDSVIDAGTAYDLNSHYIGAFVNTTLAGDINLDAWGLYNFGTVEVEGGSDIDIQGFALDARAWKKVGIANLSLEGLYVSGSGKKSDEEFGLLTSGSYSVYSNFYYKHGMTILMMSGSTGLNYANALVTDISNVYEDQFLGVMGLFANAKLDLPGKWGAKVGLGFMQSAEDRAVNGNNYMGTEINADLTYQLTDSVGLTFTAAYCATGDFYEVSAAQAATVAGLSANEDPDDISLVGFKIFKTF